MSFLLLKSLNLEPINLRFESGNSVFYIDFWVFRFLEVRFFSYLVFSDFKTLIQTKKLKFKTPNSIQIQISGFEPQQLTNNSKNKKK